MSDFSFASLTPRYSQLADLIRNQVARGEWKVGDKLPSSEALARTYGVARVTVRSALAMLIRDGVLIARQGSGTFVVGTPFTERWLRVEATLEQSVLHAPECPPEFTHLSEDFGMPNVEATDGALAGSYVNLRRVDSRAGSPYCVASIFLDQQVFERCPERFRTGLAIPVLRQMGAPVVGHARQTLAIGNADVETAALLKMPVNAPIAEVKRVITTSAGVISYFAELIYPGNIIHLEMDLRI